MARRYSSASESLTPEKTRGDVVTRMDVPRHPISEDMAVPRHPNGVTTSPDKAENQDMKGVTTSPAYTSTTTHPADGAPANAYAAATKGG